jgi:hypothetical protein
VARPNSSHHTVKLHTFDGSTGHRVANVALEALPIRPQILRSFFVQRIGGIRLKKEKLCGESKGQSNKRHGTCSTMSQTHLHAHNNRIQVQNRLPVLPQNIQTDIPLQVNIRMINLLRALHFWRVMREVLVNTEIEMERATLVHALVGLDRKRKVEDIVRIREIHLHRASEGQLLQI